MKLLTAAPADGVPPLLDFFDDLEEKQRQKLLSLFSMLLQAPAAVMREPNVKRVKAIVNGTPKHVYVCTHCLRSGKVTRAV